MGTAIKVIILGITISLLGIFGYYKDIMWLFYVAGGLCLLMDITALFSGGMRWYALIITITAWISGYYFIGFFWDGLIWGSCISVLVVGIILFIPLTPFIVVGAIGLIVGPIMIGFNKIRNLFRKNDDIAANVNDDYKVLIDYF